MKRLAGWSLAVLLSGSLLVGCSGGEEDAAGEPEVTRTPTPAVTPTPSASPYLPVPDDVELTAQGTALEVGERAVVAWRPRQAQDEGPDGVGVLDVKVTGLVRTSLEESFQGWQLGKELRDARPYFVEATIRNVGDTDLGGVDVPLYLLDRDDTLVQASEFAERFAACPSTPFPDDFGPGEQVRTCLVYLVPDGGRLAGVSFRPTQEFVPITWTGEVESLGGERKGRRQQTRG